MNEKKATTRPARQSEGEWGEREEEALPAMLHRSCSWLACCTLQHQVNAPTRSRNEKGSLPPGALGPGRSKLPLPLLPAWNIFTAKCGSNIVYTPTRCPGSNMHLTGSRSALYNTKHGQDAAQAEAEAALGALGRCRHTTCNVQQRQRQQSTVR